MCCSAAPVKGEVKELLKHKFLDVDLPYELRVTEAALTEFIRCAPSLRCKQPLNAQTDGLAKLQGIREASCSCDPDASDPGAARSDASQEHAAVRRCLSCCNTSASAAVCRICAA